MKVIVNDNQVPKEKPFPKLMINTRTGLIAMMINPTTGVVIVKAASSMDVGEYSCCLTDKFYKDFEGSVTLSND